MITEKEEFMLSSSSVIFEFLRFKLTNVMPGHVSEHNIVVMWSRKHCIIGEFTNTTEPVPRHLANQNIVFTLEGFGSTVSVSYSTKVRFKTII